MIIEYSNNIEELDKIIMQKSVNIKSSGNEYVNEVSSNRNIFSDFLDDETLRKIREFEKNNPEKIKKWREEEEEKHRDWFIQKRSGIFGNIDNNESDREIKEIIKICLKYNPNKFVISVTNQYFKTGKISDKQLQVLMKIAKNCNGKYKHDKGT